MFHNNGNNTIHKYCSRNKFICLLVASPISKFFTDLSIYKKKASNRPVGCSLCRCIIINSFVLGLIAASSSLAADPGLERSHQCVDGEAWVGRCQFLCVFASFIGAPPSLNPGVRFSTQGVYRSARPRFLKQKMHTILMCSQAMTHVFFGTIMWVLAYLLLCF